jgi:hypothetical protein
LYQAELGASVQLTSGLGKLLLRQAPLRLDSHGSYEYGLRGEAIRAPEMERVMGLQKKEHSQDDRYLRSPLEQDSKQTVRAAGREGGGRGEKESLGPLWFLPIMKEGRGGNQQPSGAKQYFGLALSAGRLLRGNGAGIDGRGTAMGPAELIGRVDLYSKKRSREFARLTAEQRSKVRNGACRYGEFASGLA